MAKSTVPFVQKLVLCKWALSFFNAESITDIAQQLRHCHEGCDENNVYYFHHQLVGIVNVTNLTDRQLLKYDENIVKHTQEINEVRLQGGEPKLEWKYFQYLALLFTEIYLDYYFNKQEELIDGLNAHIDAYNDEKKPKDQLSLLGKDKNAWKQLNKISYWMATGGGKTLVMHANIKQFNHYSNKSGKSKKINRTLLITPNEGLSQQHLKEFDKCGIRAEIFNKDNTGMFSGKYVEIIEITKLGDETKDKTVAVDAFEGSNLVLVDEGHRGSSSGEGGQWMQRRNKLCEEGFSFEYSATFGQAVHGDLVFEESYAKSILIDYSYRYFHADGYGKDYQILNLDEKTQDEHLDLYMVASVLSFYQQIKLFKDSGATLEKFQIEKPLWVFVGGSVTKSWNKAEASDIVSVLKFIDDFIHHKKGTVSRIQRVLDSGLPTSEGRNLLDGRFPHLRQTGFTAEDIFQDIMAEVFHATGGGKLYVENLKGAQGEIALKVGADNEPFGVINVGDDNKLVALCADSGIDTGDKEFSGSLFQDINSSDSSVNLLIGSRKFTEGWSSWRVSTMGLLNIGKKQGAQIIQLFGRGVRLKGFGWSLKRSSYANLPEGLDPPKNIKLLERLDIFGIHADYMAQFREFLESEEVSTQENLEEILLPVIKNGWNDKLQTVRLKKTINGVATDFGNAFRTLAPVPTITRDVLDSIKSDPVVVNWYPKIQGIGAGSGEFDDLEFELNQEFLLPEHLAFMNQDRIYFELNQFKAERGWYNLNINREEIPHLLLDKTWYQLLIPKDRMKFDGFGRVSEWEKIALALLKNYVKEFYVQSKREWEGPHLEYRKLTPDDSNFYGAGETEDDYYYKVKVNSENQDLLDQIRELKDAIEHENESVIDTQGLKTIWFGNHLYEPMLSLEGTVVEISPAPLNKGEKEFVEDLKNFYSSNNEFFDNKELFLLRNLTRGKGVGFFEAGNFYPDFIIWLLVDGVQHIIFVDPKGIWNIEPHNPKIKFYSVIKEIEERLGDNEIKLHSFIVSNTPSVVMQGRWALTKDEMEGYHIVFQAEDRTEYIQKMFSKVLEDSVEV